MIARVMCFFLGHSFARLEALERVQPYVYVRRGPCARCGTPIIEVRDLRDEDRKDS